MKYLKMGFFYSFSLKKEGKKEGLKITSRKIGKN